MTGTGPPLLRPAEAPRWADDLVPVEAALREAATREAGAARAAAGAEASAILSRSADQAADLLDRARREGAAAARAAGRLRLTEARRRGRDAVLSAQEADYLALRAGVLSELQSRLHTPSGLRLRSHLLGRVASKGGAPAVEQFGPGGAWRAVSRSGSTGATLDLETVVDQVLRSFAPEVAALWR